MNTEVEMKRSLFGKEIRQKSKSEYFCATDLVKAGNVWRMNNGLNVFNYSQWLNTNSTQEFIARLEKEIGQKVIIKGNQKNSPSWIHPYLFIDLALAISPDLKIEVYNWLFDNLLKYRNDAGDSYKKMCGALFITESNKQKFQQNIIELAERIKKECEVDDWNKATEEQLKLRDKIHENIALLSDIINDRNTLYAVAIKKAKE